ncbi:RNA 3'-terminal phosphate cyclase [Natronococcus jeotgali]|uniref:RNA 3'-terminal phosphate cyclase n=1 Tax=Natronococcus jeotgali DSM 18795 TaxID=1227498 RepID=L9XVZ9_9EURY|nr:RNA 3'-terminal phosphate cyclase [Natronococcus jeotgali]ELY65591.1 RNA 3'-terminal-phosphate cyclase [Natronococcus jeotgali DSM 18795]
MRELDGSSAGGQFLRTALTLSVLEDVPIRVENVRGDRDDPGLGNQHLAVLETMAEICDAEVSGAELGAETVEFDPGGAGAGGLAGGSYAVDIGTAGSVTLLFDALLPLATVLEAPLSVTATGGTDVEWSPPLEYFRQIKLPLLGAHGLVASCEVDRRGFYPDGGGRATLRIGPSSLEPLALERRGDLEGVRLYSTESASLADRDVAHRQLEGALERLDLAGAGRNADDGGLEVLERQERTAESPSPGSALVIRVDHGTGIAGFDALGERGKPAERVGEDAADAANRFLEGDAAVDRHMGDQLLIFLALAGGRVRVPRETDHVETSRALLEAFGREVDLERREEGAVVSRSPDLP